MFRRSWALLVMTLAMLVPASSVSAASGATTILFVGGYGSTLASAVQAFAPLRSALQARDSSVRFAVYSYAGWDASSCAPLDYDPTATGQDFELSERRLLDTIYSLRAQCGASHIVVIGHSLGGLVAFHALSDNPMGEVTDVVTVDSPLGGAPSDEVQTCVDAGLCVDGPVTGVLADLHGAWGQTQLDNAARVRRLQAAGTRVTAWGNQSDCLYSPGACVPFARLVMTIEDVAETQWLGVERAKRLDFVPRSTLASVLNSHQAVLSGAATQIAADVLA